MEEDGEAYILSQIMSHPDFHATTLKLINHDKVWFEKNTFALFGFYLELVFSLCFSSAL